MRLTRRQRKERKARGLSVDPTVLESSRSLFDTLDRIMPREILAPLNEVDWRIVRDMSAGRSVTAMIRDGFRSPLEEHVVMRETDARAIGLDVETLRGLETKPRPLWTPRHGGGATLTVGDEVVAEIEPMGGGWWVGVGDGDLVNGTLQEAKVRAVELLSGVSA